MNATVVITSKNRKADLATAVQSALEQTAKPEVLVIDDGSTDGTSEMIRERFPTVRLERSEQSAGLIVQRNRGANVAGGEVIFSIDDDAIFSTPHVVEQTLAEFTSPRIGAIAIPFINVNQDQTVRQLAPADGRVHVAASYIGTAHAVRRDVFLRLGGYREHLFHQGEEGDFCIRLLAAGYVVALGRSDPIHHFESPRRDTRRMGLYGRRNDILFAWHNVPLPGLPGRLIRATAGGLSHGLKHGQVLQHARGLAWGYGSMLKFFAKRSPVPNAIYRLQRRLIERGSIPLDELESQLPALPV
jgi:glycosyltransferase involved in cell wall biosynthesis